MEITQEILDYGLLAEFAYIKFENYDFKLSNTIQVRNFLTSTDSGLKQGGHKQGGQVANFK